MNISINGLPVVEARILVPRTGNWTAEVIVDADTAAQVATGGAGTLSLAGGALAYVGTVSRADSYAATVSLRMVGGSGKLNGICQSRFYAGVTVGVPLADALSDAGEALSAVADQAALAVALPFWSMIQRPVAIELSSLAQAAGPTAIWRVQPDGSIFFGSDAYLAASVSDYDLVDYLPQEGIQTIAAEVPDIQPGQSFRGHNISAVEHTISAHGSRAKLWLE